MEQFTPFSLTEIYSQIDRKETNCQQRPRIGISGNYKEQECTLAEGYYASIWKAGGVPVILPPTHQVELLVATLEGIDALLLSGGGDINPLYWGEEPLHELGGINPVRDRHELMLAYLAVNRQIPILGICRGMQLLNVALGGTLYQDIHKQMEGVRIKHSQELDRSYPSHTVTLLEESTLYQLLQQDKLAVNSFHHQAIQQPAPGFKATAWASDGVIEAMESTHYKSMLAVQWHPECFILKGDHCMLPLFEWLVKEATSFQQAKQLHTRILTLDSHCDTPMWFDKGVNFAHRDPQLLVDLHKMEEGKLDASIMVAYLEQGACNEEGHQAARTKAHHLLDQLEKMVATNPSQLELAYTPQDLYRNKAMQKRSIMLGVENGYAMGEDLNQLLILRERGVVYMTLCHNGNNAICGSARHNEQGVGLTPLGYQVVAEMNRLGMMIDLSHAGEQTFYDVLAASHHPVVASHSSARALCNHPRNLTDEQLRALAAKGGVVQITLYSGFLKETEEATILDAIRHINHAVAIMGIDHVGIGTDFDGDGGIRGCASASELINLTRALLKEGYTEQAIEKIWGGNFLRVMREVQKAS